MRNAFSILVVSSLLCVSSSFAGDSGKCAAASTLNTTCSCSIADLHPTQISVGMIEVKDKEHDIKKMGKHDLDKFESENPEPTVIGPQGKLFIIDHHHLARALYDQGVKTTYCQIAANFSNMNMSQFWATMNQKRWVYPYDEQGRGPLAYSQLPDSVDGLKDDPYRSLAGAVRKAGGYDKTSAPFAEFQWAAFFRSRIDASKINNNFDKAVKQGVKLAHSPDASNLPGYQK